MENFTTGYLFVLFSIFNLMLGIAAIGLLYEMKNGIIPILKTLIYPMYCFIVVFIWSIIGQALNDHVRRCTLISSSRVKDFSTF